MVNRLYLYDDLPAREFYLAFPETRH
jgi:hypothetical protein